MENRTEFISHVLQQFCRDCVGISDISPGTPWNNGHIESFNNRLRKECLNRLSVRTLHRYYPAKAGIVWGGLDGSVAALRNGFDSADDRLPVIETVTQVVVRAFDKEVDKLEVTKTRLGLTATTSELHAARRDTYWVERKVRSD